MITEEERITIPVGEYEHLKRCQQELEQIREVIIQSANDCRIRSQFEAQVMQTVTNVMGNPVNISQLVDGIKFRMPGT